MLSLQSFSRSWRLAAILMGATVLFSCSDDDSDEDNPPAPAYSCAVCTDTPDALAVHDNSTRGVYKGTFIGSSGTAFIDIQNGSNAISLRLIIDGDTLFLTSTAEVVDGQPYVAPFTGTYNGSPVSVTFSVGVGGADPYIISSDIPGHPNATFDLAKETSTSLIEGFQGTYSITDGETGVFNILLSRSLGLWGGTSRANGEVETNGINGTILSNGQLTEEDQGGVIGTLSGDVITGSFTDGDGETVTISGQRTL